MKLYLRPLAPGETDAEFLWVAVSLASASLGIFWLRWHLPLPECPFAHWTGLPCPTCGGTRLVQAVLDGNASDAFALNPLLFLALLAGAGIFAYSAVVVAFRLRRVRCGKFPEKLGHVVRGAAVILFLANWLYLVCTLPVGHGKSRADFHRRGAMHGDILDAERG